MSNKTQKDFVFYFSTKSLGGKTKWSMYLNFNNHFYEIESFVFDDANSLCKIDKYQKELEPFDSPFVTILKTADQKRKKSSHTLLNPPYIKTVLYKEICEILSKFSREWNGDFIYPNQLYDIKETPKGFDTVSFISEIARLNKNKFKYVCLVDYDDLYDEIVKDPKLMKLTQRLTLNEYYKVIIEQSYHLINTFLENNLPSCVLSNIYANNCLLMVDSNDTLVKFKLNLNVKIVEVFEIEKLIKAWEKIRVINKIGWSYSYDGYQFNYLCVDNEKIFDFGNIIKNTKNISENPLHGCST